MGRRVRQPVRRSARADRVPQLGQRPPARRRRSRRASWPRCCSRTRSRRSSRRATSPRSSRPRPTTSAGGPGVQAHNRWLADFCAAAPGRRAGLRAGVPQRPRRHARRDPLGEGEHATCSAASCCRTSRRTRRFRRCGTRTTSRCGSCARSSTWCATSTPAAASPTSASTRRRGRSCSSSSRGSRTARSGT